MTFSVSKDGCGAIIIPLLLQQRGEELHVTEDLVVQIVENDHRDAEIMKSLLNFRDNLPITKEVFKAVASIWYHGHEAMKILLCYKGNKLPITEKVVLEAAGNYGVGRKILQLLFDCRGSELPVTETVIIAALDNWNSRKEAFRVFPKHERNDLEAFIKKLGYEFEEYYDQVQQDGSNADERIFKRG